MEVCLDREKKPRGIDYREAHMVQACLAQYWWVVRSGAGLRVTQGPRLSCMHTRLPCITSSSLSNHPLLQRYYTN